MKQVLTPEQMRHLSELGCSTRKASMCLIRDSIEGADALIAELRKEESNG